MYIHMYMCTHTYARVTQYNDNDNDNDHVYIYSPKSVNSRELATYRGLLFPRWNEHPESLQHIADSYVNVEIIWKTRGLATYCCYLFEWVIILLEFKVEDSQGQQSKMRQHMTNIAKCGNTCAWKQHMAKCRGFVALLWTYVYIYIYIYIL